jgi:hypothetical protein
VTSLLLVLALVESAKRSHIVIRNSAYPMPVWL